MQGFLSIITSGLSDIIKGWFELKKAKQQGEIAYQMKTLEGEQSWDMEAMKASKYSWKDELITGIWYSPLIIGWFDRQDDGKWQLREADEWIEFVAELPYWWQFGAFGIMAASFGLRWYFKKQNFVIGKENTNG